MTSAPTYIIHSHPRGPLIFSRRHRSSQEEQLRVISNDGSASARRVHVLWNPPIIQRMGTHPAATPATDVEALWADIQKTDRRVQKRTRRDQVRLNLAQRLRNTLCISCTRCCCTAFRCSAALSFRCTACRCTACYCLSLRCILL